MGIQTEFSGASVFGAYIHDLEGYFSFLVFPILGFFRKALFPKEISLLRAKSFVGREGLFPVWLSPGKKPPTLWK